MFVRQHSSDRHGSFPESPSGLIECTAHELRVTHLSRTLLARFKAVASWRYEPSR
jgi:hypothetical protein